MKPILLSFAIILLAACHGTKPVNKRQDISPIISESVGDTLKIFNKVAVFYAPDSVRLKQVEKMLGTDTFHLAFDDYAGGAHDADEYLETKPIFIRETNGEKYLEFIGDTNIKTLVKLDTLPEYWGIFFFAPNKKPKLVDEYNIEKEYDVYYK